MNGGMRTLGLIKKRNPNYPVITIITAVYNGVNYLEATILSILGQNYENIEYIIIDGGSSDGSVDIIRKYEHLIEYWVSEKDKGISDAFNKGISFSRGDFINFQGDGDGFSSPQSLAALFASVDTGTYLVCGRIKRVDKQGNLLYISPSLGAFSKYSLLFKMALPHQGLFMNINMFKEYGLFDSSYKFAMDYEHLLRAYHHFPSIVTKDLVVAQWRADGVGEGKTLNVLREYDFIKRKNNVAPSYVLHLINAWSHFKYYLKRLLGV